MPRNMMPVKTSALVIELAGLVHPTSDHVLNAAAYARRAAAMAELASELDARVPPRVIRRRSARGLVPSERARPVR